MTKQAHGIWVLGLATAFGLIAALPYIVEALR
jgi:predicted outer membrane lipoprotein